MVFFISFLLVSPNSTDFDIIDIKLDTIIIYKKLASRKLYSNL